MMSSGTIARGRQQQYNSSGTTARGRQQQYNSSRVTEMAAAEPAAAPAAISFPGYIVYAPAAVAAADVSASRKQRCLHGKRARQSYWEEWDGGGEESTFCCFGDSVTPII
jgi:hypothetical protein